MKPLLAFVASMVFSYTFVGATCNTPVPTPPPDVIVDAAPPDCRCKPCPANDAACPIVDAAVVDATPSPKPVDAAPPAPASPCQGACDGLKRAGCREGNIADCANKICQINADPRFVHYNVTCLQNATTPASVAACGGQCTP
jgi:hypothetical protein